MKKCLRKTDQL